MKDKLIIAAALIILIAVVITCNKCWITPTPAPVNTEPEAFEWVNGQGDIVSSLKGEPEAFAKPDKKIIDSLAKVYNTRIKHLQEYIIAMEATISDIKPVPGSKAEDYFPQKDSCPPLLKNVRQQFKSAYYTADVQIGDSSYMHLQSKDTLTVLWKRVKEGGLFNRRTYLQLDISKANPDSRVYGINAYRVEVKQKKWSIGIQAGYGFAYDGVGVKQMPYVGIGISKSIVRF